jgi:hypothetical protein
VAFDRIVRLAGACLFHSIGGLNLRRRANYALTSRKYLT